MVRNRLTAASDREFVSSVYRLTPAGTSEVAEMVGLSRQAAEYRLKQLEEEGVIWSKLVGPTRVWIHRQVMEQG